MFMPGNDFFYKPLPGICCSAVCIHEICLLQLLIRSKGNHPEIFRKSNIIFCNR